MEELHEKLIKVNEQEKLAHELSQLRKHLDKIKSFLDGAEREASTALEIFDQVSELDVPLGDKFERISYTIGEAQDKLIDFNKELRSKFGE